MVVHLATHRVRRAMSEADWWDVRDLISELWAASAPGHAWEVRRWDGRRFYEAAPAEGPDIGRGLAVLTDRADTIVAAVHDDGAGSVALQAPPDGGSDVQLLEWAERELAGPDGSLRIEAPDGSLRAAILRTRGYVDAGSGMTVRRRRLDGLVVHALPAGYVLREAGPQDGAAIAALLDAAFGRTSHTAGEFRVFARCSPGFDRALHVTAVDPAGTIAAHVGVTIDPRNALAIVEPVATHPDHRGRGLARFLLSTALARAVARGATAATLDAAETDAATALYDACGFVPVGRVTTWRRDRLPAATSSTLDCGEPPRDGGHP